MKKVLVILVLLLVVGIWYVVSGAGDFIRTQIEQQGTRYLNTPVSVANVDLALTQGRMTINGLTIKNPQGFSEQNAFSLDAVTLDLGEVINQPYVVQTLSINAPEILYEVDASGQGNLIVLKNNLDANLPKSSNEPTSPPADTASPLVIVDNVTVKDIRLKVNFEQLSTGDLNIETKAYEITLPTFNAGSIGKPNGMPADQVGAAVVKAMLDNVISAAKSEAKKRLKAAAKEKAAKELDKQKDKLLEKANDKLKGLFN
ncbi:hypothetical protein RS130_10100 [Paraglaciecola aquimarina]|uniref:AsmA domain-containing protein n=1 Tax=Paraglaciecola aquimarina TaxID=1235557 RepID=A0ABU3SWF0_9ALTE|nr:hypothetical protein [Paraglaciecola aquimarina]MDU0354237.1 hypothetical protein [Paraglaciecola aquimarina]